MGSDHDHDRRVEGRRLSRRHVLGLSAAGMGAGALLAACGKTGHQSKGANAKAGPAGQPRYGGQLNVANIRDPATFDPATKLSDVQTNLSLTSDPLLGFDAGPKVPFTDIVVKPRLAERWETPDAQTFTFHLRNDVKFANLPPVNGRPMTADDVKWTFEYLTRTGALNDKKLPPAPVSALFETLDGIQTPDPATVVVRFAHPFAPFLNFAATPFESILAHEIFDQDGDFSKRTAGTGPWQLDMTASQSGQRWVFKKNPNYFLQGRPYIDLINRLVIPDDVTQQAAFQTKQLDLLDYSGMPLDVVDRIKKEIPEAVVFADPDTSPSQMYINSASPPLNDVRIRKAMSLGINRDEIIKVVASGKGVWALASSVPGLFTEAEVKQIVPYDPEQAKKMVGDAGYPNGVEIEFMYPGLKYGQAHVEKVQLIQAQLKNVGINIRLKVADPGNDFNLIRTGNYQIGMTPGAPNAEVDLDAALYPLFHPSSTSNYYHANDPQLTPLLEAERQESDPAKRKEIIRQAVRRINEVPWALGLFFGTVYKVAYPSLKNYAPNMAWWGQTLPVVESWLEK